MRWAAKVDENQAEVVRELIADGNTVQSLARLGDGVLDLLVGRFGMLMLIEVKMPGEELTPKQKTFLSKWAGYPIFVVESGQHAVETARRAARRGSTQHQPTE